MISVIPVCPGFELPVTTYAEDQPGYMPLPCFKDDDGTIVSRWKLTWKERVKILIYGNLWLTILISHNPLQPVHLDADCPIDYGFNTRT